MTIILAINAGSSSLKVSVFEASESSAASDPKQLANAQIDGITSPPATFKYERGDEKIKGKQLQDVKDQPGAFSFVLDHLTNDQGIPQLKDKNDIRYVCHRIVHGGNFSHVQRIDRSTMHHLEQLSDLAPLHNSVGLSIARTAHEQLPKAVNMALFDSSYHTTIPKHISSYAIDPKKAEQNKLKKYGFHGISYSFIAKAVAKYLNKDVDSTSVIALHLGSGASACCIKDGRSLDNSMGLTPLAGLPGGTRSGDIDPSLMFHYTHDAGKLSSSSTGQMHITQAEEILNKQSGFKALTGTSDFGEISSSDDPMCKLTVDLFTDRVLNFVGSYYLKLGGKVDALVFAGGIGEKGAAFRKRIVDQCECLGFSIDAAKNDKLEDGVVADIGRAGARHRTLVCHTDEQLEMARTCIQEAAKS